MNPAATRFLPLKFALICLAAKHRVHFCPCIKTVGMEKSQTKGVSMLSRISAIASVALALCLSGCATKMSMPYAPGYTGPSPNKAIYLMTVTLKNTYHTSFQPDMLVLNVEKAVVSNSDDRFNLGIDDKGKLETGSPDTGNTYLVRMELEPGEYVIRGVTCLNQQFPIAATFFAPLHEKLVVTAPGIYYLGHVDAIVRERVGKEFKAGPTVPLIDQGVAGASGGTFDIAISDRWDQDTAQFQNAFPAIKVEKVQKAILPPFDRAVAQKWWEDN
jgi:hypothetical protein